MLYARSECSIMVCDSDATDASYCLHIQGGMSTHPLRLQSFTAQDGAATLQAGSSSCCRRRMSDPTVRSEFESQCEQGWMSLTVGGRPLGLRSQCSDKLCPAPVVRRGLQPGHYSQVCSQCAYGLEATPDIQGSSCS